ncbi:calpain-3-like [Ochlerotatus camptorhynchus]|uniref:calpain-3-like n=1 Tax=Ochlerotatus camptorhynchus TaxID=644619 RepID=UPI0031CFBC44
MDSDNCCSASHKMLSPFLVVEFTDDDDIAYKSFQVLQNSRAQRFYNLREHCLSENILFEDPDFPVEEQILFGHPLSPTPGVQWLRPPEFIAKPKFFVHDSSEFNVQPGCLPCGWLQAAILTLSTNKRALERTAPHDNCFEHGKYAGIFHFRFWKYGRWLDVVIDDRLPTIDKKLIFTRSSRANEMWCCLLEKAYAKFRGSYNALNCGMVSEAMQDFSGGITECVYFKGSQISPQYLYDLIDRGLQKGSMMAGVKVVDIQHAKDQSCCIHPIIQTMISGSQLVCFQHLCEQISRTKKEQSKKSIPERPSKFWLRVEELMSKFHGVEMCHISPDPLGDPENGIRHWSVLLMEGAWVSGHTAGGCRDHPESYGMNPKHDFNLSMPDDESGMCSIVISLMQKQITDNYPCLLIGFAVYRITGQKLTSPMVFSNYGKPEMITQVNYSNSREVICRLKLAPGRYRIVSTTKQPHENGNFVLRVYWNPRVQADELDYAMIEKHPAELLLTSGDWELLVRMFYDLANHWGLIECADVAFLVLVHFSDSVPKSKRPKKSPKPQSKPVVLMVEPHTVENSPAYKVDSTLHRALVERINLVRKENSVRFDFKQFLQIVKDNRQSWQELFDCGH